MSRIKGRQKHMSEQRKLARDRAFPPKLLFDQPQLFQDRNILADPVRNGVRSSEIGRAWAQTDALQIRLIGIYDGTFQLPPGIVCVL
ncbi:hypothetical protein [Paracoccus liaowanqingii]|uniref:hypothetical protein n=1 Tax=Paracoccus liaowanqingii TaxID=2560053 RepID=UPI001E5664D8|nr:hypothetical protein [Paracoccus liaowanqingii]